MNKLILAFLLFGFGIFNQNTYAQSLLSANDETNFVAKGILLDGVSSDDNWAVFSDEENHKFYIDLEKLHIYLDKISVLDQSDKIIFNDNLWNVTPNSIYELDLNDFPKGNYRLEFKTINDEKFYKNFEIK